MRPDELPQRLQLPFRQDGANFSPCRPQMMLIMLTFETFFERRTVQSIRQGCYSLKAILAFSSQARSAVLAVP